jgi:hypothetical protein
MTKKEKKRFQKGMKQQPDLYVPISGVHGDFLMKQSAFMQMGKLLERVDKAKDSPEGGMAHEAGHMILLRKYFPENPYTYGCDEESGLWCVIDKNSYDAPDGQFVPKIANVAVAGMIGMLKYFGFTLDETKIVMNWMCGVTDIGHEVGGDMFKFEKAMELIEVVAGKKPNVNVVFETVYNLLDTDEIKREIELQTEMKKTA